MRTIRTSSINLTCIPTYVGYLAMRELWGKDGDPLILVDWHFCDSGKNLQQTLIQEVKGIEKKTDDFQVTTPTFSSPRSGLKAQMQRTEMDSHRSVYPSSRK